MLVSLLFLFTVSAAGPDFTRVSARDFEDFEACYGSFEGAAAALPALRPKMSPDDFDTVQHAMRNLADDLAGLRTRLAMVVFGADRNELLRAHMIGRLPWQQPENQTIAFWSRNGPMSVFCFGLTKRLNEGLPAGF